jgi:transposase-like protein
MSQPDYDDPFLAIRYAIDRHHEEAKRIRRLVLEQQERGTSRSEIGRRIGVKPSTLQHWITLAKAERNGGDAGSTPNLMPFSRD